MDISWTYSEDEDVVHLACLPQRSQTLVYLICVIFINESKNDKFYRGSIVAKLTT